MMAIPWWVASIIANACCIASELIYRRATGGWVSVLPYAALPVVVGSWALFGTFNGAPHWLLGWAVFALGSAVMRVSAVHLFGTADDGITSWLLVGAGYAVMLLGSFILKEGLS